MGEAGREALRVGFEGTIKLEFHGAKVSSDAGLFPYRDSSHHAFVGFFGRLRLGNPRDARRQGLPTNPTETVPYVGDSPIPRLPLIVV